MPCCAHTHRHSGGGWRSKHPQVCCAACLQAQVARQLVSAPLLLLLRPVVPLWVPSIAQRVIQQLQQAMQLQQRADT